MMNGEQTVEPINLLLSRDELLFVLRELQTDYLPGLDPDPLGQLSPEQESLVLTIAGRALQARELVRRFSGGELVVHNALLTMVGVCAYSQSALMVYHWPSGAGTPRRYFGHIRGEDAVVHSRPDEALHLFTLLPSKEALVSYLLEICRFQEPPDMPTVEFVIPASALGQARSLAVENREQAIEVLVSSGVTVEATAKFVDMLSGPPRMSIMQAVKHSGNGHVARHDFTLLQNGGSAWLVIASTEPDDTSLQVKTARRDELQSLFSRWLF